MTLGKFQKYNRIIDIPLELISDNKIKCVMLDMDSTLLVWHGKKVEPEEEQWCLNVMNSGAQIIIVSNALSDRTKIIADQLGISFIPVAAKPFPFGLLRAAKNARARRYECLMIGDQIFTDRVAAALAGIKFILVEPLSDVEFGLTKVNRKLEKFFLGRDTKK